VSQRQPHRAVPPMCCIPAPAIPSP
jgi:hypothetical protein